MAPWLEVLQWLMLLGLGIMLAGAFYLLADLNRRLGPDLGAIVPSDGLAIGSIAPDFKALDRRSSRPIALADFEGQRVLVAFLSPSCRPCLDLVPHLNRFAQERVETPIPVVALAGRGVDYVKDLSPRIAVVRDEGKAIQEAFEVHRTPLVYLLAEERRVLNRTVSNSLVDLEDTLNGLGQPQGSARWVPEEEPAPGGAAVEAAAESVRISKE